MGLAGSGGIVLASTSSTRQRLLQASGVPFVVEAPRVDEWEFKLALEAEGASAARIAEVLAEAKAVGVSRRKPGLTIIGADQVLQCGDRRYDKPVDRADALSQLKSLRGRRHELVSCAVAVKDGLRTWHAVDRARLEMRNASDDFLELYLDAIGDDLLNGPGAYRIEGLGSQLFSRIEGSHYTVMGLPVLPLLEYLRQVGILVA